MELNKRNCQELVFIALLINFVSANVPITVKAGGEAVLPCDLKPLNIGSFPYVIEWSRQDNPLPIYYKIGRYPARVNANFKGRTSLLRNSASLRIHNVRLSDEGWYECRILLLNNNAPIGDDVERNGTWVKLVVTARPTITSASPPTFVGKEKESLMLRCKIVGKPTPEVAWWKDDWPLVNGENGYVIKEGELFVASLEKKHRGRYECRGWNSDGQVGHTTQVYVKAPPELVAKPQNLTLKENLDAYFSCKATGYPSNITYRWYYEGKSIESVTSFIRRYSVATDGTLAIFDVSRDDSGRFSCTVSNGYGGPVTGSAHLTVQYQARVREMPATAYGGLSLTVKLPCDSEGEPPINTVTWRKDGEMLRFDPDERLSVTPSWSLQIKHMLRSDGGRYTCTPYNILGSTGESSPLRLIPKEAPRFTISPQTPQESEIGKPFNLFCNGVGDPAPTLSWRKIGKTESLPNQRVFWNGGNLTITSVKKEDHGLWQCLLTSPVAQLFKNVNVNVKYTTPHDITNLTVVPSYESALVRWLPGYDGGYPQHFMIWFKRVDQGDHAWLTRSVNRSRTSAVVNRLEPETVYQFAVLAENVLGSGRFSKTATARTKALPTEAPMRELNGVPPPRDLKSVVNERGMVALSWKQPKSITSKFLLGYLVEYRVSSSKANNHVTSTSEGSDQSDSRARERRWITEDRVNQKRSIKPNEGFSPLFKSNEIVGSSWEVLAAYPANTSRVQISAAKLYQDTEYEFHVLAVTPLAYSPPSQSVFVNTSGLVAYLPLTSRASISAAALSGIISGVIFMCLMICLGLAYYCCQRKSKNERDSTTIDESKNFLSNSENVEHNKKILIAQISNSGSTNSTQVMSTTEDPDIVAKSSKFQIFRKLKKRLCGKNKNSNRRRLVKNDQLTELLTEDQSSEDSHSSFDSNQEKSRFGFHNDSEEKHKRLNSDNGVKTEIMSAFLQNKPRVSPEAHSVNKKSVGEPVTDDNRVKNQASSMRFDTKLPVEEGPSLEIDCSRSDVEVRFVAAPSDRHWRKPQLSLHSRASYSFPHQSKSAFSGSAADHLVRSGISVHQKSFSHYKSGSEFIYLTGYRKIPSSLSNAEGRGSRIHTPVCLPDRNPTPYNLPHYKYHYHTHVPGGHFHVSPRESFSGAPQSVMTLLSSPQNSVLKNNLFDATSLQPRSKTTVDTSNKNSRQTSLQSLNELQPRLSPERCASPQKSKPLSRLHSTNNQNTSSSHFAKSRVGSMPISQIFRSNSCSLPLLTNRKCERYEKRFSSVDDMLMRNGEEEDQERSFTSGSESTVRFVRSLDGSFSIADERNDSSSTIRLYQESKNPNEESVIHKRKPRDSSSPVVPASEVGGGSCSGYESQNTSSETSSNHNKHHLILSELNAIPTRDQSRESQQCCNRIGNDVLRESTASSEGSRSRRDNSSVDDKYEWDKSELAVESEILEALENLDSRNHDGTTIDNLSEKDCLSPEVESSYSKEKMEKRCAALKEEYLQHKRRLSFQKVLISSPDT